MPIRRGPGGKGWRYGNQKVYSKRRDALKQMAAIKANQKSKGKAKA
jgi:hypothetical protein